MAEWIEMADRARQLLDLYGERLTSDKLIREFQIGRQDAEDLIEEVR